MMGNKALPVVWQENELDARMLAYRQASMSEATKRVIIKVWTAFDMWCRFQRLASFPCNPAVLARYLVALADRGLKPASIGQAVYGIGARHRLAGVPSPSSAPEVRATLGGIRRTFSTSQRRAAALTIEHVRKLRAPCAMTERRDRALLMVAVASGLRSAELVALTLGDVDSISDGYRLLVRRSKGDQEGKGATVEVVAAQQDGDGCPARVLGVWMAELRSLGHSGASASLFPAIHLNRAAVPGPMSVQMVRAIVRKAAVRLGLDPSLYSGHSTRAGCATYLLDKGVPLNVVADHLRHSDINITRRYDRNRTSRALKGVY